MKIRSYEFYEVRSGVDMSECHGRGNYESEFRKFRTLASTVDANNAKLYFVRVQVLEVAKPGEEGEE